MNIRSKEYPAYRGLINFKKRKLWAEWNVIGEVLTLEGCPLISSLDLNFNTIEHNVGLTDIKGDWIFENDRVEIMDEEIEDKVIETVKYEREAFGLCRYQKFTPFCELGGIKQQLKIVGNWHEETSKTKS